MWSVTLSRLLLNYFFALAGLYLSFHILFPSSSASGCMQSQMVDRDMFL
jgi:hypothetical protein